MHMCVQILVLGAGWTSSFVKALCDTDSISYAATTRSGRDATLKFVFDPHSDALDPYTVLPSARTVIIIFPITVKGASERLIRLYSQTHQQDDATRFVQLGATSIWDAKRLADAVSASAPIWYDRHSPFTSTPRAEAEDELLALSPAFQTTVLNLSGLWGGTRSPRNWVDRVAPSKEALRVKGSIHLIHGTDVARAILAVHRAFARAQGQRWILSDGRVYDWWDLASAWGATPASSPSPASSAKDSEEEGEGRGDGGGSRHRVWVRELMDEAGVRALPRDVALLGRALDSRDFWRTFGLSPVHARIEE